MKRCRPFSQQIPAAAVKCKTPAEPRSPQARTVTVPSWVESVFTRASKIERIDILEIGNALHQIQVEPFIERRIPIVPCWPVIGRHSMLFRQMLDPPRLSVTPSGSEPDSLETILAAQV